MDLMIESNLSPVVAREPYPFIEVINAFLKKVKPPKVSQNI